MPVTARGLRGTRIAIIGTVGAFVVCVSLSGCFLAERGAETDAFALSVTQRSPVVAVCSDLRVSSIDFNYRVPGGEWVSFLSYDGPTLQISADTILTDDALHGMGLASQASDFDLPAGSDVEILMLNDSETWDANFKIPNDGVRSGRWIRGDATVADAPCD